MSPVPSVIGPYRVERELARGGMGVLYLARDTRLDRAVALKSLPDALASDPDRLLRFEREAKVLAALSHPNLAGIYGVEEVGGRRYLALEYVEGETLAARIARGPLPAADAVEIGLQIAAGLEAAHESGIVHRDLKPANVMITAGDVVKVVDFGLAKGRVAEAGAGVADSPVLGDSPASASATTLTESPALPHSPTIGTPATLPGVILGTAAYLSPEQARGKAVDRRTDIWSFGCVLYECLTGRRAFEGETVSDVIAAILSREVEWERLPRSVPARLREMLERCLEKDPRKRLRDIGDVRLALEEIREGKAAIAEPAPAARLLSLRVLGLATVVAILCTVAGVALWNTFGPLHSAPSGTRPVRHVSIEFPGDIRIIWAGDLSPDGRYLITYGAPLVTPGGHPARGRWYRRRLGGDRFEPIQGTEGAIGFEMSPDGRWCFTLAPIAERTAARRLIKIPLTGGAAPVTVANWEEAWNPVWWVSLGNGDVIAAVRGGRAYVRIPAGSTATRKAVPFDASGFAGRLNPYSVLPNDRGVLLNTESYGGGGFEMGTGLLDLRTGKVRILLREGGNAKYSPTGHLLFTRRSTLLAVGFDLSRLEVKGEPFAVADGLRIEESFGNAQFSLSNDGTLAYMPGGVIGKHRCFIVADVRGQMREWSGERGQIGWPICLSPAGNRIAYSVTNARAIDEIWVSERGRASAQRLVAVPGADCDAPAWAPDGRHLSYFGGGPSGSGVYIQPLDGGAPRMISRAESLSHYTTMSWSPDGANIVATKMAALVNGIDIVRIPVPSGTDSLSVPVPLRADPDALERRPSFCPDGRWIAYESNESGREEIYVARFRRDGSLGTSYMVSSGGGFDPRWGRSGRELFYQSLDRAPNRRVMSVALRFEPVLTADKPATRWHLDSLRVTDDVGAYFDILPTGGMVAIQKGEDEVEPTRVEIVLNFFEELKQKALAAGRR